MKPAIAIALIVSGVVLICVPVAYDYKRGHGACGDQYSLGCFLLGAVMIGCAISGSWAGPGTQQERLETDRSRKSSS